MCNLGLISTLLIAAEAATIGGVAFLIIAAYMGLLGSPLLFPALAGIIAALALVGSANAALGPCFGAPCTGFASSLRAALIGLMISLGILVAAILCGIASLGSGLAVALTLGMIATAVTWPLVGIFFRSLDVCRSTAAGTPPSPASLAVLILAAIAAIVVIAGLIVILIVASDIFSALGSAGAGAGG
jgi:hypothetical protein